MKKVPEETRNKIKQLLQEGIDTDCIMERFNVGSCFVSQLRMECGIGKPKHRKPKKAPY